MGWVYNVSPEVAAQSYYPAILAVCVVLTTLMTAVVSLRIYIHIRAGRVAPDDYVIFFSMVYLQLHFTRAIDRVLTICGTVI